MIPSERGMPEPNGHLPEPAGLPLRHPGPAPERGGYADAAALPPALASGPDLVGLLKAFRRRWLVALSLGVLAAAGAAAAVWLLLGPTYAASGQIRVRSGPQHIVFPDGPESRAEFLTYLKTQIAWLKSPYVLTAALKRDEVKRLRIVQQQDEPLPWLGEELKVESPDGSEFIVVTMSGAEPAELIALINGVTQAYWKLVVDEERQRRTDRRRELEGIEQRLKGELQQRREQCNKLHESLGSTDGPTLSQKQQMLVNDFTELRRQLAQVAGERVRLEGRLAALKAQEKSLTEPNVPDSALSAALAGDPAAAQLRASIARLDEIILDYVDKVGENSREPGLLRARSLRQGKQKQLEARRAELRAELQEGLHSRAREEYKLAVTQAENEIGPLKSQEEALKPEVQRLATDVEKIGTRSASLEMLLADIRRDEATLSKVGEELRALNVELGSPPRVEQPQEATAQRKDRKRQLLLLIAAPVAAFLGLCLAVSWWEFRGRRIHTPDEVSSGLGVRVVGAVPALPRQVRALPLPSGDEPEAIDPSLLESIDGIRTLLLRDASVEATRLVMVTSAVGGEGKTTLATHLAGSLARAGRRTLLIDCDLRTPSVHQWFELPAQPGFSEVVLGEVHAAEATLATATDGLWVMPAGQWDREVLQALARDGAREVFDKLRAEYDFIVVDSHPVLPATDSLLIGQHVDAVIVSLLRDVSQVPKVYAACQRLTSLGIRLLGAVVNGTHQDVYGNGHQYEVQPARA